MTRRDYPLSYTAGIDATRVSDEELQYGGPRCLLAIAAILLVLWLLGFLAFHLGAFIHILIVVAIVVLVLHFIHRGGARGLTRNPRMMA